MKLIPKAHEEQLGVVLCATLAAVVFELAATTSFYILDLLLIVLAAVLALTLIENSRAGVWSMTQGLAGRLGGAVPFLAPFLLAAYVLYDLANIISSPAAGLATAKYKVVVLMLVISLCLLVYVKTAERLRIILLTIGVTAGAIALITIINYLFGGVFPIFYTMRLTLRKDYNVFATTLLLGYLCIIHLFVSTTRTAKKCALFALDSAVTLTVLYLSGSRRVFLMLPPILIFWLAVVLFSEKSWRSLAAVMLSTMAAFAVFLCATFAMQSHMHRQYEAFGGYGFGQEGSGAMGEGTPAQRYETVEEGNMLAKRKLIWGIAWEEYKGYSLTQKIFGKGFGYDIILYDNVKNDELAKEYAHLEGEKGLLSAHNFLLADLLNGGIVKALLGVLLLLSLLWACIQLLLRSFMNAAFYANTLLVVVLGSLISNRYGLLYDKFFYIFALLLLLQLGFEQRLKRGLEE